MAWAAPPMARNRLARARNRLAAASQPTQSRGEMMGEFMTIPVPTVDIARWAADHPYRRQMADELDDSLRDTGMFLLTGHDVPPELAASLRRLGRSFFMLPDDQKIRYAVRRPYDNGWRGLGLLAASAADDGEGLPDLPQAVH